MTTENIRKKKNCVRALETLTVMQMKMSQIVKRRKQASFKNLMWRQRRWNSHNCETGGAVWDHHSSPYAQVKACWSQRQTAKMEAETRPQLVFSSHLIRSSNMFLSRLKPPPVTVSVCKLWHHLVVEIQTAPTDLKPFPPHSQQWFLISSNFVFVSNRRKEIFQTLEPWRSDLCSFSFELK